MKKVTNQITDPNTTGSQDVTDTPPPTVNPDPPKPPIKK
jgi:hypothetical protein